MYSAFLVIAYLSYALTRFDVYLCGGAALLQQVAIIDR